MIYVSIQKKKFTLYVIKHTDNFLYEENIIKKFLESEDLYMEFDKKTQSEKTEKYKFCDRFLHKFDVLAKAYDAELKTLRSIEKEIKDTSHGVCNSGYNVRCITPSDISTYVANFDKALAAGLLQPSVGDCNLFAVESVKKFIEANGCIPFDMPTIGGTKNTTLTMADLGDLELIVANETFKKNVYSTSELKTRAKYVKEDLKKFESMHFTAAVRSLISKLPTIIEKHSESACACTDIKCKHELGIYVGNFILFALKLNLLSLEQMRLYTVPQVTFDTCSDRERKVTSLTVQEYTKMFEEDGESLEVYQEAVNVKDKQPIFFVFSKGIAPILSKSIMKFTNSKFSHMGIAFSPDCRKIYTYTSRGEHRENYVSGETGFGFTIDSINDLKQKNQDIAIMVGYISNGNYEIIKEQIEDFAHHNTTFDATLFLNYLRNKPIKNKNKYAQVCSTFCDYILKSIGITVSNEPVPSPGGMKEQLDKSSEKLNNVFEVFSGKAQEYIPETAEIEVARFAARDHSRAFDEMYTECYHITKVDSEVRSIIPFGLNFRDIALSDDHEYYKNTSLASNYLNEIVGKFDSSGSQNDAHEFLVFVLDRLNIELLNIENKYKIINNIKNDIKEEQNIYQEEDEGEWEEVKKGGKTMKQTNSIKNFKTSILGKVFQGILKQDIIQKGNSQSNCQIEPFFTLHLDNEENSIENMFEKFFQKKYIVDSGDKYIQSFLEKCPTIFIINASKI